MTGHKLHNGAIEIARETVETRNNEAATFILAMKEKPGAPQGVEYITWRVVMANKREMFEWGTYHFDILDAATRLKERIYEYKRS